MTDKQKIETLRDCFAEVIWMAIRYANGRHTYAPDMVRVAINNFKTVFPDWQPKKDKTIKPLELEDTLDSFSRGDYLDDLF
ncbi:MAG: hypothetical protein PHN44_01950 [Candidatus Marinimicrobia bacterium]|nr:hypothetical protein [Candidatus Neomarinimicrobiota bacterium]